MNVRVQSRLIGGRVGAGTRRGGVYVLVLVVTAVVSAMALLGLRAAMAVNEQGRRVVDSISARQNAASAVEIGLHTIENELDWRVKRTEGTWLDKAAIGTGTASVTVEAVGRGAYSQNCWDPIELSGYGFAGSSRSILRVQIALRGEFSPDHIGLLFAAVPLAYWPLDGPESSEYDEDVVGGNSLVKAWSGSEVIPGMVPGLGHASSPWFGGVAGSMEAASLASYADTRTVSVWFWVSSTAGYQGVVTRDASGRGGGGRWELGVASGELTSTYDTSSRTVSLTGGTVATGQWNHAVLTVADSQMRLYLNGVRIADWSSMALKDELAADRPTETIRVGVSRVTRSATDSGISPINGSVCELALLRNTLADDEVLALYNAYPAPARYAIVADSWERVVE